MGWGGYGKGPWFGFKGWMNYAVPPADSMEVRVLGQKWDWNFQYTDAETGKSFLSPELKVPSGIPVKLVMQSQDVLHSFYVPDFRIKRDVVPKVLPSQFVAYAFRHLNRLLVQNARGILVFRV